MASNTSDFSSVPVDDKLYSRQLFAIGHEAMKKLTGGSVLIMGINGLGLEIAKSTILTGVGRVVLWDLENITADDLATNYYVNDSHFGENRATAVLKNLSELNQYVKVETSDTPLDKLDFSGFTVVVTTDMSLSQQEYINLQCHKQGVYFIGGQTRGLFGQVFLDFGDEFVVQDTNGERPSTGMIEAITQDKEGMVIMVNNMPHKLQSGDTVLFSNIEGMVELNNTQHKVRVVDSHRFTICDTTGYTPYFNKGEIVQIKEPQTFRYKRMVDDKENPQTMIVDLSHIDRSMHLHKAFMALDKYEETHKRPPRPWNNEDGAEVLKIAKSFGLSDDKLAEKLTLLLSKTAEGQTIAMTSTFGGFIAQEVMKGCTHKYTPLNQWLYFDATRCLPDEDPTDWADVSRYQAQTRIFGKKFQRNLAIQRWFVVGAGAIGCEHLKNMAMMGVGCSLKGGVIVTDMDTIEVSNLNRQFLFRQKHVGKSKSLCAAQAAKTMNPSFNIMAHENRVGKDTENIYSHEFYNELNGVANALDNLETRLYVDDMCVNTGKPLLECGTLGTKGNVQTVVPHMTESYGSSRDPPEDSIPMCTLRNFPNLPEHTIEWSRDLFTREFENRPLNLKRYLSEPDFIKTMSSTDQITIVKDLKLMLNDNFPRDYTDCIKWGVRQFILHFRDQIGNLLHQFPPDHKTTQGSLFWSGSKRCPSMFEFDGTNKEHYDFVVNCANLQAQVYGITQIQDSDYIRKILDELKVDKFTPDTSTKFSASEEEEKEKEKEKEKSEEPFDLEKELEALPCRDKFAGITITPLQFEKDDDLNGHVKFITTCSNMRSMNYGLKTLSFHEVKGIAGKIIAALITTTSMVSGLVMLELFNLVQMHKTVESYSDYFLNLANPQFMRSDPKDAPKYSFGKLKDCSMWSKIKLDKEPTLDELITYFDKEYDLDLTMLTCGGSMVHMGFLPNRNRFGMKLSKIVETVKGEPVTQKFLVYNFDANDSDETVLKDNQVLPTLIVPVEHNMKTSPSLSASV